MHKQDITVDNCVARMELGLVENNDSKSLENAIFFRDNTPAVMASPAWAAISMQTQVNLMQKHFVVLQKERKRNPNTCPALALLYSQKATDQDDDADSGENEDCVR
jgi:hypothetical protein